MPDDDRSMRDTMEEVYDRMTADDPPEESHPAGLVFTGGEESEEARARAERLETMGAVWDKYNGPEAKKWEQAEAPDTWSREARDKFADLSPDAKKMVLTEWEAGVSKTDPRAEHWGEYLDSLGTSADDAFEYMMQMERTLRHGSNEQKRQLAWNLINDYQIDLLGQAPLAARDPVYAYLLNGSKQVHVRPLDEF